MWSRIPVLVLLVAGSGALSAAPLPIRSDALPDSLREAHLPALHGATDAPVDPGRLPFDSLLSRGYQETGRPSPRLTRAVRQARTLLWAVAGVKPPADLTAEVGRVRRELRVELPGLWHGYRAPNGAADDARFKEQVRREQLAVSDVLLALAEAQENLQAAGRDRASAPRGWQATHDLVLARLQAETAFFYEYQTALGQLRKDMVPRDPAKHGGWRLVTRERMRGDFAGKKLAKASQELVERIVREHPRTPWEVLARRLKDVPLGLQWQPCP